jgi:hypothetical protein
MRKLQKIWVFKCSRWRCGALRLPRLCQHADRLHPTPVNLGIDTMLPCAVLVYSSSHDAACVDLQVNTNQRGKYHPPRVVSCVWAFIRCSCNSVRVAEPNCSGRKMPLTSCGQDELPQHLASWSSELVDTLLNLLGILQSNLTPQFIHALLYKRLGRRLAGYLCFNCILGRPG